MNVPKVPEVAHAKPRTQKISFREVERSITAYLMERYGPLLDAKALAETFKFPTIDALERSLERGYLRISTHEMPHRRGRFALAHQVAKYLAQGSMEKDFQVGKADTPDLREERPQ